MGIQRSVEWRSTRSPHETDAAVRAALTALSMEASGPVGVIAAKSPRALLRNRWAAQLTAEVTPCETGSKVRWTVDSLGDKHFDVVDDVAAKMPDGVLDGQGIEQAVADLGHRRVFGRREIRQLHNLLHADEDVITIGQGQDAGKMGILVLTTRRLFFYEKSLGSVESLDEFPITSIASVSVQKTRAGETLIVHSSGNNVEITSMGHGHADAVVRGLNDVRRRQPAEHASVAQALPAAAADDPVTQIEKLAGLRDRGLISEAEFAQKKIELLQRM